MPEAFTQVFDGRRTVPSLRVTQLMLDLLSLTPADKVLEVGTGSGTQTNLLAQTGAEIHSIELEPWVDSTKIIGECVFLHAGDGAQGLPRYAPFTAILGTCGVEQIPKAWTEQLADGGRLVVPVGEPTSQRLTLFRKEAGELVPERIGAYVRFQMLRDKPAVKPPKYQPDGTN